MSQHRSSLSVIAMPSPASAAPGSPLNIVDRQFAVMSRSYCRPRPSTDAPPAMKDTASDLGRSEEHPSELQSLMRLSYAVFCLKKIKHTRILITSHINTSHNNRNLT